MTRHTWLRAIALAIGLSVGIPSAAGALTTVDTGAPNTETGQCCLAATSPGGPGGSFGQVVTAPPSDTVLDSFSFYVRARTGDPAFNIALRAEVYPWDGLKAEEPSLWESETQVHTLGNSWTQLTFQPAAPPLVAGEKYVLFVTTEKDLLHPANDDGSETELTMIGAPPQDNPYAGGFKVEGPATFSGDTGPWTTQNWTTYEPFGQPDRAFKATFSAALSAEGAPGSANCMDGIDNDFDTLTDGLDPDCRPSGTSDKKPPPGKLSGPVSQKLGQSVAVFVSCPEEACLAEGAGILKARGVAAGTYRLKGARKAVPKGGRAQLRLRLPRQARGGARRALRRGKKVRAMLTVTLTDKAGNTRTLRRTVKLKSGKKR